MKQSMLKSIKGFFNSTKEKAPESRPPPKAEMQPRVINFGTAPKTSKNEQDQSSDIGPDTRYDNLEPMQKLKDLGLRKDEIEEGEVTVLQDVQFVLCKLSDDRYEETRLIVTNYKLCLYVKNNQPLFFPLSKIDKIAKYTTNETIYKMQILLKDGRKFKFRVNSEVAWKKIYDRIEMFAFVKSKRQFFAYRHYQYNKQLEEQCKGWQLYDAIKQFSRMGLQLMEHSQQPNFQYKCDYKIIDNKDGNICSTYPAIIVVPARMPLDSLKRCARFRSRYAYQYEPGKFSAVFRSSQSKVGVQNSRSSDDELMLRLIGNPKMSPDADPAQSPGINCKIYDARGFYAAFGNKISGKGYESEEFYSNCKLEFLNIPNIHVVRQAYLKTIEAAFGQDSKFYVALAESKWYEYIYLILYGALDLAKNLSTGMNCLVHCSDGWDRTSQLCSLGAMILDPYYRTLQGFQILIEKDWINFGHQFAKRLGQGMNNPMSEQKSQVFLQFLDCVTQLMHQFPAEFEFNYKYIQELGQQAYSNLYGNFLCNSYFEMVKYGVKENTVSLWSKIIKNRDVYLNPFYYPTQERLLNLDANEKNMRFWKEHFLQHVDSFKDVYGIYSCKFTQDNLQIIHQRLKKQKTLLQEKSDDYCNIQSSIDAQIKELQSRNSEETTFKQLETPVIQSQVISAKEQPKQQVQNQGYNDNVALEVLEQLVQIPISGVSPQGTS